MISKYMRGRLGNQLFQYAAIRYIQEINGNNDIINLNFSKYVYSKNFENELKYFNVKDYNEVDKIQISITQKINIILYKILKRIIRFLFPKNYYIYRYNLEDKVSKRLIKRGIYWKEDGKLTITSTKKRNKIVIGHFESKDNFNSIKDKLIKEITPKYPILEKNKELYKTILNNNSVCISIRRGDFVENKEFSKIFNVCNKNYFEEAIKEINKRINNPVYIIFSDDIKWCKKEFKDNKLMKKIYFEDGTDPVWEKLRLMYSCKNFIISNSTFSWWAQYLSRNNKKIVIAPKKWKNTGHWKDIYEKEWILINN